jgi:hypothetical protein
VLLCACRLVIFNQLYPPPRPPESVGRQGQQPPAPPPPAAGNPPRWFDAGLQADWGAKDSFYGAGDRPAYAVDGRILCDDTHLFQIATCWSSRPANSSSRRTPMRISGRFSRFRKRPRINTTFSSFSSKRTRDYLARRSCSASADQRISIRTAGQRCGFARRILRGARRRRARSGKEISLRRAAPAVPEIQAEAESRARI